jgi:Rrf2 family protein
MMGEYAIRAMLYLCSAPEGKVFQISEIAKENEIPDNFLRKIIPRLCRAGILKSQRGTTGGITLLKKAEDITPLHVIEATEGGLALNKCLISSDFCSNDKWCSMHVLWAETQKKIREILSERNFAQLADENSLRLSRYNNVHFTVNKKYQTNRS